MPILPVPAVSGARESGQSHMMDKTFAGQNKCSAKDHERPFVIEWDATDMSSFEARAAGDVVVVKYEGCHLEVLERCGSDSIKGALGAYGAVEWTSGSVEKIDVANEAELFAKLPLGAASLGARLEAGEQFHMEYYVTGTKKSTRSELYRTDLDAIPGCRGATHFVHAYNLGAFALGSTRRIKGGVDAMVWGIGAGAKQQSLSSAEKMGGALTSCTGVSAHEVATCQVPIRLTLRSIAAGENPDVVAAQADETPTTKNLAGKIDARLKGTDKARAHYEAAIERHHAGDGKGCLRELDAHDRLQPNATLDEHAFVHRVLPRGVPDAGRSVQRGQRPVAKVVREAPRRRRANSSSRRGTRSSVRAPESSSWIPQRARVRRAT